MTRSRLAQEAMAPRASRHVGLRGVLRALARATVDMVPMEQPVPLPHPLTTREHLPGLAATTRTE